VSERGTRRTEIVRIPACKAPVIRRLLATLDEIEGRHGRALADAILRATDEGLAAGLAADDVPDAVLEMWLRGRVAVILEGGVD